MARRLTATHSGSILILTVWTLFFLAALAVAVGSYVSGGLTLARAASADAYGRAAINAGIEHAVSVLDADTNQWDAFSENWGHEGEIDWQSHLIGESYYRIYHINSAGETNTGVIDEESRINLNKASRTQLEATFRIIGGADAIESASLASAVVDWRDKNDDITEGGAESGFYGGLQPGYPCANADLRTVYELLLLRGMRTEIFEKLSHSVTVYGTGKVNLNTADRAVLQVIAEAAGADEPVARGIADKIVGFRQSGGQFSQANAMGIAAAVKGSGILGVEEETVLMRMMVSVTLRGSCFRGIVEGGRPTHAGIERVEFVYSKEKNRILFWNEI
jgi:general secretion pathway protein K